MASLNEVKYDWLYSQVLPANPNITINELEYAWLAGLTGKPRDLPLSEQWHLYLDLQGIPAGKLNQRQYAWLLTTGVGAKSGLTLNENFYLFWNQTGVIGTAFPDLTLTAGDSGGSRVGFSLGSYGSIVPTQTTLGDSINALFCNNNNGRVRFKVQGEYQPDDFISMEIVGVGTLLASNATYDYDGIETEYRWDSTGFNLVSGTVYAVEFT